MYPNLARKEAEQEAKQGKSIETIKSALPSWATSIDPSWASPRAAPPRDYSRVPHLHRIKK